MSILPEFQHHELTPSAVEHTEQVAGILSDALTRLRQIIPPGRETSLMVTHLQTAKMWACAAIAAVPANRQTPE